jgi:ATP-binding cassette subfamily B (MDR/TAP) protein 1
MEKAASAMTKNLKIAWFKALLRQDIAYHDIMDVSGEATIITASANRYHKGVGRKLSESIQYSVTFFGGLAYAFWACWQVSLAVLGLAPLVAVFMLFLAKMHTSMTSRAHSGYSQAGAIVSTSITNIRTVLALNAVEIMIAKFCQKTSEAYHSAVSQVALLGLATGLGMSSVLCTYIVVAFMGAWLLFKQVKENGCDPSAAVVENPPCQPNGKSIFGSLMGITFSAMVSPQISVCIESFFGARIACYPALAVIRRALMSNLADRNIVTSNVSLQRGLSELPPYKIDSLSSTGKKLESVRGDIEFRNVSFHYPARKEIEVFNDVSLKIEAGKITALVGVSGCGKSTVLSLLERFYDPTEGSILLDGVDLRDLNIKWLRNQIGLVSQEPKLFQTSIRDNIGAGVPNATNKQIEAAARMANVHEFIESLPRKYDTDAGALGSMLSGGQKQRICIARCLMKKPKIILLGA